MDKKNVFETAIRVRYTIKLSYFLSPKARSGQKKYIKTFWMSLEYDQYSMFVLCLNFYW